MESPVFFAVMGFDEPHQAISLLAGIEPDALWCRGEPYCTTMPEARRGENRWILGSGLEDSAPYRDHFEKLLLKLERLGPQLSLLQARYRCGIGLRDYHFHSDPAFFLPQELLDRFATLNIPLTFDQWGLADA